MAEIEKILTDVPVSHREFRQALAAASVAQLGRALAFLVGPQNPHGSGRNKGRIHLIRKRIIKLEGNDREFR